MSTPITFIVSGQDRCSDAPSGATRIAASPALPPSLTSGRIKHSIRPNAQRAGADPLRVTAIPGEDVVVLCISGGPALVLHPETARDLMLAQGDAERGGKARSEGGGPPDVVSVPACLRWPGLEQQASGRGPANRRSGTVLLAALDVVTGLDKDAAIDLLTTEVVKRVDAQVEAGVYALDPDGLTRLKGSNTRLDQLPAAEDGGPLLVLIHGTFVETLATFGKLWTQHPRRVLALFEHYRHRVYALEHPTLGVSPIVNALTLARTLPAGARLHLVAHSRGGLVAETLARVCAKPQLDAADLQPFIGSDDHAPLRELAELVKLRDIRVERVVRVACPARGTLLASGRLDAFLSVFKWTLDLAGVPVLPTITDLLREVALRRKDEALLPGLAAQMPGSPLLEWLSAAETPIPGDLCVVAGDIEGDSIVTWLKTLMADAYFWTDNDLVVQTRSMYGGAPRAAGAKFFLDRGAKVTHFDYFGNERTADAIVNALVDDTPSGFRTIGPLSWAGESVTGERAAVGVADVRRARDKPAVFLLPGVLGSNLKSDGERIWLNWRFINGLGRLEYKAGRPDRVEADGLVGSIYDDLAGFLSRTHELIEFAFDWRRPMEDEAQRLADAVEAALLARSASGQPVRLLAHSMGGLLARTMQLERPEVWERMMARQGARCLMLGPPNAGSWAPMQVLSGDDTFGNMLVAFGSLFRGHDARALLAAFPGFLQQQAGLLDPRLGLGTTSTWQSLADADFARMSALSGWHSSARQLDAYRWGVPPQDVLDRAVRLRKRLDAQVAGRLPASDDQILLVMGQAQLTPDGFEVSDDGFVYLDSPEVGDGRVTLASARLPGVRAWQANCEHGRLATARDTFPVYLELLERGDTARLPALPSSRGRPGRPAGLAARVRSRPAKALRAARPPESERELYSRTEIERGREALRITVVNGDLRFVRLPLLVGHYRSRRLMGAEKEVDRLIGGGMTTALALGIYPDMPCTQQVLANSRIDPQNPWRPPQPAAAIVVGLGDEGKLRATELVGTVRQGVIEWARHLTEQPAGAPAQFEIAATPIGSGGAGISAGQAAQLVAQGVREANERLAAAGWPQVEHLQIIDLYLDRASEAWSALQVQATAAPGQYSITDHVQGGIGGIPRALDFSYRGADYDFITALAQRDENGGNVIVYTVNTHRARTEVRAQSTQAPLLRELVTRACDDQDNDAQFGRSLFRLLVPLEVEPFLGGTTDLVIELDRGTADIPWEMLDTTTDARATVRPWAIRTKLLRKLREAEFRMQVTDAGAEAHVLVIGEPLCDPLRYPPLPGASAEARAVAERLGKATALGPDHIKLLAPTDEAPGSGPDARTIINALLEREWRVVHIAGHGELSKTGEPHGVVLSHDTFLSPREIRSLRVVPELVFINCCHLAAIDQRHLLEPIHRPGFAASVAEELIRLGVRCVIAAGWAVEDDKAMRFATSFYDELLRGCRFIDAVARAREDTWVLGGNTWAAYHCYGDPDWTLNREPADAQRPASSFVDESTEVASPMALALCLETLAIQGRLVETKSVAQQDRLLLLDARFAPRWGNVGIVAYYFGAAWAEAGDPSSAMKWYERALAADDGTAPLKAAEELGRLRAERASVAAYADSLVEAQSWAESATEVLERLAAVHPSLRREQLCGHAYARRAAIAAAAGRCDDEAAALAQMRQHYARAELFALDVKVPALFRPVLDRMAAELMTDAAQANWPGFDPAALSVVKKNLAARIRDDPDFDSVQGRVELHLYEALARGELAGACENLQREYTELHARMSESYVWQPVRELLRLVLAKYAARANTVENTAATTLLSIVEALGTRTAAPLGG